MPSKNTNEILGKAVIRCKKAQALARPLNDKKKVKAGVTVHKKMVQLMEMTKENEYGKLTDELQTLDNMIANMQLGVLEGLLESVETIERRMKSIQKKVSKTKLNSSTSTFSITSAFSDDEYDTQILPEETNHTMSTPIEHPKDGTSVSINDVEDRNDTDDEIELEITTMQHQRFIDRLRNFFSIQRIAEERMEIIDPQGKVRYKR
jgi:hypothetical protein